MNIYIHIGIAGKAMVSNTALAWLRNGDGRPRTNINLMFPFSSNYLNSQHRNINFTMVTEINRQLPFLDTLVKHNPNILSTSI